MRTIKENIIDAVLVDIYEENFTAKNGKDAFITTLHTDKGRFTAHSALWRRLKIADEKMQPGVHLRIKYTTFKKGNREFKNFKNVEIIEE